jgi:phosphoglycerol transferase MdoB-like AlkP superfamily enzyme
MEDLYSVKLTEAEIARAKSVSRRVASIALLMFLACPISLIVSLVLRGKVSSFNTTVDSYLMPTLHGVSPGLWRFINYGFTTGMRYSAEYLLVGWVTSVGLGIITAFIAISAVRQMDLNYFIFNAQETNRRAKGLGFEFLLLLGGLAFAALMLFIVHEVDFVSLYERKARRWASIYFLVPVLYPVVMMFLLVSEMQAKKIYILLQRRLRRGI